MKILTWWRYLDYNVLFSTLISTGSHTTTYLLSSAFDFTLCHKIMAALVSPSYISPLSQIAAVFKWDGLLMLVLLAISYTRACTLQSFFFYCSLHKWYIYYTLLKNYKYTCMFKTDRSTFHCMWQYAVGLLFIRFINVNFPNFVHFISLYL